MPEFKINAKEITSPANVLRLAAEVVEHDLRTARNAYVREGCCYAFAQVRQAAYDAYNSDILSHESTLDKRLTAVSIAQELFESLYRPDFAVGYWMGERKDKTQQLRRINALLVAAELA